MLYTVIGEAQWLGGRMLDSRSRQPGHESSIYNGAVDGDTLWRCYVTTNQNPCMYLILGNKCDLFFYYFYFSHIINK